MTWVLDHNHATRVDGRYLSAGQAADGHPVWFGFLPGSAEVVWTAAAVTLDESGLPSASAEGALTLAEAAAAFDTAV